MVAVALLMAVFGGVALAATFTCSAGKACLGTDGDDTITGTGSRDTINPFGGNDLVRALGGNDDVRHSYGNDTIYGDDGNDTLRGGFGNDEIWGGPGRDLIDCAYIESRDQGEAYDIAHTDGNDTVVDCKTVVYDDRSR